MSEDSTVLRKVDEAAPKPAEVDEEIFLVHIARLTRTTNIIIALRVVGQNRNDVGGVSEKGKGEEQHAQALGRFSPPVHEQLGDSRRDVRGCTEIAKDLACSIELEVVSALVVFVAAVSGNLFLDEPAQESGGADCEDNEGVEEDAPGARCKCRYRGRGV